MRETLGRSVSYPESKLSQLIWEKDMKVRRWNRFFLRSVIGFADGSLLCLVCSGSWS